MKTFDHLPCLLCDSMLRRHDPSCPVCLADYDGLQALQGRCNVAIPAKSGRHRPCNRIGDVFCLDADGGFFFRCRPHLTGSEAVVKECAVKAKPGGKPRPAFDESECGGTWKAQPGDSKRRVIRKGEFPGQEI